MNEPRSEVDQLAHQVIGAAIEVHRLLGPGYLETVYEEALEVELELRRIPFARQVAIAVDYNGRAVGEGRPDFLVGGELIVELKAVEGLAPIHSAVDFLSQGDRAQFGTVNQLQRPHAERRCEARGVVAGESMNRPDAKAARNNQFLTPLGALGVWVVQPKRGKP